MSHEPIKPCPHCGGSAVLNSNYSYKIRSYFIFVKCEVCGAQGKMYTSNRDPVETKWNNAPCNNAVDAWNLLTSDRNDDDDEEDEEEEIYYL